MVFWFGVLVERFRSFNASRSDVISSNHFIFHHCIFQICRYQLNQTIFWIVNFSKFSYQLWKSDFFRTMWIKYPSFFFHLKSITLVNEKEKSFRQISFYIIERDFILRLTTKYKEVPPTSKLPAKPAKRMHLQISWIQFPPNNKNKICRYGSPIGARGLF